MKLTVCLIIPTLVQGGAEKQLTLLAENLDKDRFEVHVVVLTHSGPLEQRLQESGVPVHLIGKRFKFDPTAARRLRQKLRELNPDIVHTWLFAANSYGRYAAKKLNVPIIVAAERCVDPWKSWWHGAIDKHFAKSTDVIATNTNAVVDFYENRGIEAAKFEVIPNAVVQPSKASGFTKEQMFAELGIPPRGKVIGSVGRLWKQKGYKDLIWAAELLRAAYEDVWYVIVGDGPERGLLQEFRDSSGADQAVRFAGHRTDASRWIQAFDVLWNGSLYEGQSNTILEAMAHGVPVLATDIPGNRDLVEHERTGFLYPIGDIKGLGKFTNLILSDPERLKQMGHASRLRAEQEFSLENMVGQYEQLYTRLAKEKGLLPE